MIVDRSIDWLSGLVLFSECGSLKGRTWWRTPASSSTRRWEEADSAFSASRRKTSSGPTCATDATVKTAAPATLCAARRLSFKTLLLLFQTRCLKTSQRIVSSSSCTFMSERGRRTADTRRLCGSRAPDWELEKQKPAIISSVSTFSLHSFNSALLQSFSVFALWFGCFREITRSATIRRRDVPPCLFCPDDRKRLEKLFEVQFVSASATENPTIICVNRLQIKRDSVDDASPAFELMNRSVFLLCGAPDSFLRPALTRR